MSVELEPEALELAALYRFVQGLSWERVAKSLGCCTKTLRRARDEQSWQDAKAKVLAALKSEGPDEAWGCLVRQAHAGDVSAAKEILSRLEGPVSQHVDIRGKMEHEHSCRLELTGDAALAVVAFHGAATAAASDAEVDAVHPDGAPAAP